MPRTLAQLDKALTKLDRRFGELNDCVRAMKEAMEAHNVAARENPLPGKGIVAGIRPCRPQETL